MSTGRILLRFRTALEAVLWQSRWALVTAVALSVIVAGAVLWLALVDGYGVLKLVAYYSHDQSGARQQLISTVIEMVDEFLLSAMMLIFAIGLYSIFIGHVTQIPRSRRVLVIESLDDLKSRLSKTILLIMFVRIFGIVMESKATAPSDVAYLGLGMLLAAGAIWLLREERVGIPRSATKEPAEG